MEEFATMMMLHEQELLQDELQCNRLTCAHSLYHRLQLPFRLFSLLRLLRFMLLPPAALT
jgi:hypothetical protein